LADRSEGRRLSAEACAPYLPYDRASVTPGIVHLGLGAFCRAHLAVYVDDILPLDPGWGIIGASLKRPDTRNALAPQDGIYTLAVRSGIATTTRFIGSVLAVLDANTERDAIIAAMTDPRVRIVSLTITEKGYCRDAGGRLDPQHPDIRHDVAHPEAPLSAPGLIVRALELRRARGVSPFAVLSCDNLPANGETTRNVVVDFAALRSPEVGAFVSAEVAFPSTMVDRIVPATTDDDRALVLAQTGFSDAWPVVTEPFSQWVIEDRFPAGRPPFTADVQLAADVRPFELMKLRMLNGSHSTLAYLGYLAGYQYVSDAIGDPVFRNLIHGLMTEEVIPTLSQPEADLETYRDALLARFANPALKHRTWQIAMDGSQKLPQRLLGTIRERLAQGAVPRRAALGVAAWMRYVTGVDEQGGAIDVRDPVAVQLREIADASGRAPAALVDGLLARRDIFGSDLPHNAIFRTLLTEFLASLFSRGAIATANEA
jgi:fructuronate reductase